MTEPSREQMAERIAELERKLAMAEAQELFAHRHASRAEATRDEARATLAYRDAEIARLNANGSKRYADLLDQVAELQERIRKVREADHSDRHWSSGFAPVKAEET